MSTPKNLDVNIMGREFRVACPADEEASLLMSVDYLDRKMREIRDAGKIIGIERIAIMAALNITHELLSSKGGSSFDISEFKRKIDGMKARLDEALDGQDELF